MTREEALKALDDAWAALRRLEGEDTFSGYTAHELRTVIDKVHRRYEKAPSPPSPLPPDLF